MVIKDLESIVKSKGEPSHLTQRFLSNLLCGHGEIFLRVLSSCLMGLFDVGFLKEFLKAFIQKPVLSHCKSRC